MTVRHLPAMEFILREYRGRRLWYRTQDGGQTFVRATGTTFVGSADARLFQIGTLASVRTDVVMSEEAEEGS